MKKYEQGIPAQKDIEYKSSIKPQSRKSYKSTILKRKSSDPEGMSLQEIKESGYMINPQSDFTEKDPYGQYYYDRLENVESKKYQYEYVDRLKKLYKNKKLLKEMGLDKNEVNQMYKDAEMEMLKQGLFQIG
jgi:hypothetical protein